MRKCKKCEREVAEEYFKQWNSRCCLDCDPRIHDRPKYKKKRVRRKKKKAVKFIQPKKIEYGEYKAPVPSLRLLLKPITWRWL